MWSECDCKQQHSPFQDNRTRIREWSCAVHWEFTQLCDLVTCSSESRILLVVPNFVRFLASTACFQYRAWSHGWNPDLLPRCATGEMAMSGDGRAMQKVCERQSQRWLWIARSSGRCHLEEFLRWWWFVWKETRCAFLRQNWHFINLTAAAHFFDHFLSICVPLSRHSAKARVENDAMDRKQVARAQKRLESDPAGSPWAWMSWSSLNQQVK